MPLCSFFCKCIQYVLYKIRVTNLFWASFVLDGLTVLFEKLFRTQQEQHLKPVLPTLPLLQSIQLKHVLLQCNITFRNFQKKHHVEVGNTVHVLDSSW